MDAEESKKMNMTRKQIKEQAARYTKFVEWSDEDHCFIGRCPEIMGGRRSRQRRGAGVCGIVSDRRGND